jgi:8-oxo-dGTP diphosphatase
MDDVPEVRAAGAAVWRRDGDVARFAVIHRERYDDWSLPKGKLDPGESFEEAAVREVQEEIGAHGTLGDELPAVRYRDNRGRPKVVRYWLMEVEAEPRFVANDEVDEVRWLTAAQARAQLSYPHDRDLVAAAAEAIG